MKNSIKKRGQKIIRRFSRATTQVSEDGKEHIKENLIQRFSHVKNIRLLVLEWSLLVIALILLSVTQAIWFTESYTDDVFADGGTYTEATIGDVNSLNPLFATTNSEKVLSRLLFATLSTIDYSGHPGVGLAQSITPSDDGKTWTVKLRDNLKWSDGTPITNEDVLYTVDLIKDPAVSSIYDSNLANVKVSEGENGEIIFALPSTYVDFVSALNFPIVPKHELEDTDPRTILEDSFSNVPVTSGAFSFNALQSMPSSNEKVYYLSANPYYYRGKGLLNGFAVHTYGNKNDIIGAINASAVTATAELSKADGEKITSNQFQRKDSSLSVGTFIFFNTTSSAMKNAELRTAIRQGIDINQIRGIDSSAIPLNYPILESQIKLNEYPALPVQDLDAAMAKVNEIKGDEPINIELATINSGYFPNIANALADQLEKMGIKANVSIYEENQDFINNVVAKRSYDILVYEVELGADPDPLPYYHSSQASSAGLNLSNYRNSLVDDLLLGARDTLDEALRIKKYETFLGYWVNDVPAIGLHQSDLTYYYNRNTRTYGDDVRLITPLDRFTDVTNWATVKAIKDKTP